jgi:uncharacterized metal-binding protein
MIYKKFGFAQVVLSEVEIQKKIILSDTCTMECARACMHTHTHTQILNFELVVQEA